MKVILDTFCSLTFKPLRVKTVTSLFLYRWRNPPRLDYSSDSHTCMNVFVLVSVCACRRAEAICVCDQLCVCVLMSCVCESDCGRHIIIWACAFAKLWKAPYFPCTADEHTNTHAHTNTKGKGKNIYSNYAKGKQLYFIFLGFMPINKLMFDQIQITQK